MLDDKDIENLDRDIRIRVNELVEIITKITQLIASENDFVAGREMEKIAQLQREKVQLMNAINSQERLIDLYPRSMGAALEYDRQKLCHIMAALESVLDDNCKRLIEVGSMPAHPNDAINSSY